MPPLSVLTSGAHEKPDVLPQACVEAIVQDAAGVVARKAAANAGFTLKVATANVCTLRGKHAAIKAQASAAGIHVLALQETRQKQAQQCTGEWLQFGTAAMNGQKGCALWFRSKCMRISAQQCAVTIARPDLLCVCVHASHIRCAFVTFHAPHSLRPEQEIRDWWCDFERQVGRLAEKWELVLLGDANARIGPHDLPSCGAHGASAKENMAGALLVELAKRLELVLANTFKAVMRDVPTCTWKQQRLDYVAVPQTWAAGAFASPPDELDLLNPHEDHHPIILSFLAPPLQQDVRQCRRPLARFAPRQDLAAIASELACTTISWDVNVHEHAEILFSMAQSKLRKYEKKQDRLPAKPYISSSTLEALKTRKELRKRLMQSERQLQLDLLAAPFRLWAGARTRRPVPDPRRVQLRLHACAVLLESFTIALANVKRAVRLDKARHVHELLEQMREGIAFHDPQQLYQALRWFRGKSKGVKKPYQPLQVLKDANGEVLPDFESQQQLRAKHFGAQEAAVEVDAQGLVEIDCAGLESPSGEFDLRDLPTLCDFETALRKLQPNKAPGPSGIPNELWSGQSAASARLWYPVFMKSRIRLTEPVRMSTGILITLFKGLGETSSIDNYRSIFLLEGVGKAARRCMRPTLLKALRAKAPALFQGCLAHSNTAELTHYALTLLRTAHACCGACGLVFLDVKSAYYRVLRSRLDGQPCDDQTLCSILQMLQIDPALVDRIRSWLSNPPLTADMSDHHVQVIRAMFRSSAFLLAGVPRLYKARVGVRPGDSIADTLFGLVMSEAVCEARVLLNNAGLLQGPDACGLALPVWADDAVAPVWANSACSLKPSLQATCALLHSVFTKRALIPNYAPRKSEILVHASGAGSKTVRRDLLSRTRQILFESPEGTTVGVRVVPAYKHLGTDLNSACKSTPDCRRKLAQATNAVKPLTRQVLRNEDIDFSARQQVVRSLGLSVACHNVGIWVPKGQEDMTEWISGVSGIYRTLLKDDRATKHPKFPSPVEISGAVGLPFPSVLLRKERLLHFMRVMLHNNVELWELLSVEFAHTKDSWLHGIVEDLSFVQQWVPHLFSADSVQKCGEGPDALVPWFVEHESVFRRAVMTAVDRHTQALTAWAHFQCTHRAAGFSFASGPSGSETQTLQQCPECSASFPSWAHLSGHLMRVHGASKLARAYVEGTHCPICLLQFWSHDRLLRHLSFAKTKCLALLVASRRPCYSLHSVSSGLKEQLPCVRLSGPLRPVASDVVQQLWGIIPTLSLLEALELRPSAARLDEGLSDFITCVFRVDKEEVRSPDSPSFNPNGWALIRQCLDGMTLS